MHSYKPYNYYLINLFKLLNLIVNDWYDKNYHFEINLIISVLFVSHLNLLY